jgi:hypothetical protein
VTLPVTSTASRKHVRPARVLVHAAGLDREIVRDTGIADEPVDANEVSSIPPKERVY